jgi:pimeloyl-ACP methyl ester carboxylesterase
MHTERRFQFRRFDCPIPEPLSKPAVAQRHSGRRCEHERCRLPNHRAAGSSSTTATAGTGRIAGEAALWIGSRVVHTNLTRLSSSQTRGDGQHSIVLMRRDRGRGHRVGSSELRRDAACSDDAPPVALVPKHGRDGRSTTAFEGRGAEDEQTPLLAWRQTEVLGRVATFGVGGEGPPVVFLHGWALSGHPYRAALKRLLARDLRVWAPALPGFGGTAPLPDGLDGLDGYAAWVDAFCSVVGITDPVVLMGHSFGGGVAIQTAHDHPGRARGLVLINSIGGSAWRRDGSVIHSIAQRPVWDWGLQFGHDVLPLRQLPRVLPLMLAAAVPNALRNPRALWRVATVARYADLTGELEELKARRVPVVVLWGERDELVTRASFDAMCEALGGAWSVTVAGSHSWLLADPDAFGEVITNVIPIALNARPHVPTGHRRLRLRWRRRSPHV